VSRLPLLAAGASALLIALPAAAQDAIRLDIPDCAGVPGAAVRELVALEVAPRRLLAQGDRQPAAVSGGLRCTAAVARMWVDDPRQGAPLWLEITLSDLAPPARPRLLALALSELIATSRLQTPAPPQPTAAAEPAPAPAQPAAPASLRQLWLGLGVTREARPVLTAPALGAGGVLTWSRLALSLDVRLARGARSLPAAELTLSTLSLALGPGVWLGDRHMQLLLAAAVRAGYAELRARARSADRAGDALAGFWLGPCAQAALQLRIGEHWLLRAGLELGHVTRQLRGLDAGGQALLELRGLWLAAQAGVSWDAGP